MFRVRADVKSAIRVCRKPLNNSSLLSETRQVFPPIQGFRNRANSQTQNRCAGSVYQSQAHRLLSTSSIRVSQAVDRANDNDEAPKSPLAIVFTDIVKSTAIWESNAEVMAKAMAVHDDLIRKLTTEHSGYEVKQNGDGFMIVFQTAVTALKFCLDVQAQLQDQDWPEELLNIGPAQPIVEDDADDSNVLWKGLRLRMAIHFGSPVSVWNDVISRWDFLGPPVNRAARYVSVCEGGQIVVSKELLNELTPQTMQATDGEGPLFEDTVTLDPTDVERAVDTPLEMAVLGERHFKGVSEKQKLYIILPKSLSGRAKFYPRHKYIQPSKGNLMEG